MTPRFTPASHPKIDWQSAERAGPEEGAGSGGLNGGGILWRSLNQS